MWSSGDVDSRTEAHPQEWEGSSQDEAGEEER